jgi:hypothetical protein
MPFLLYATFGVHTIGSTAVSAGTSGERRGREARGTEKHVSSSFEPLKGATTAIPFRPSRRLAKFPFKGVASEEDPLIVSNEHLS